MSEPEVEETLAGHSARALRVAWTPDAEPCVTTPGGLLWDSWSAALDELISNPHDGAAHERLLFYSRAQGSWGAYNLNLVRERFARLEQPDWYRDAVDVEVVWSVNQAVAFAPYDPAARRALAALRLHLPQHPQLARDVATNFPSTLAGRQARTLNDPDSNTAGIASPSAGDTSPSSRSPVAHLFLLKKTYRDKLTGFTGLAVAWSCNWVDPPHVCLTRTGADGKPEDAWFEEHRLERLEGGRLPQPSPCAGSPQHLTNLVGADFPAGTSPRRGLPPRAATTHQPPFQMPCFHGITRDEGLGR